MTRTYSARWGVWSRNLHPLVFIPRGPIVGLSRINLVYTLSLFLLCVCIYCHGPSNQLSLCEEDMNIVDFVRRKKQRTDDPGAPTLPSGPAVPRLATPIEVVDVDAVSSS